MDVSMCAKPSLLVTGASGFIGGAVLQALSQSSSIEVLPISRSLGYDFTQPGWSEQLPKGSIQSILHLAQSHQYGQFPEGADDLFGVNLQGTHELLQWARQEGVERFVFASTGNVYQRSTTAVDEKAPLAPSDYYGATKLAGELLVQAYAPFFQIAIARIFGVYGAGQKGKLVANLIQRLKTREPITLAQGEGISLTPLYIEDCVAGLLHLLQAPPPSNPWIGNLAGPQSLSLKEMALILSGHLQCSPLFESVDAPPLWFCGTSSHPDIQELTSTPFSLGTLQTLGELCV